MNRAPFEGRTMMVGALVGGILAVSAWAACGGDSNAVGPGPGTGASSSSSGGGSGGVGGTLPEGGSGGTLPEGGSGGSGGTGGAPPVTDFAEPGPYEVQSANDELTVDGCGLGDTMNYTLYEPVGVEPALLVVLGHGFQRSRAEMAELAGALASYGVSVVTPDYCHSTAIDSDPEQNAADQIALADALVSDGPRIHAGHSAGGLAAILAAESDPNAVALLALDAVDRNGLGVAAAPNVTVPTFGMDGDPHSCNSENNAGTHLAKLVPGGVAVHVVGATHCDFEAPTGLTCTVLCGGEGADGQSLLIRTLATAFVAWQAAVDGTGEEWVTAGGGQYQALVTDGKIETL